MNVLNLASLVSGFSWTIERSAGLAQGKGSGAASIRNEIRAFTKVSSLDPSLAIDMGGNKGVFAHELTQMYPHLELHIFEPSTLNLDHLNAAFSSSPNTFVVPMGLSNVTGAASLFSDQPGSGFASLTRRNLDHAKIDFDFVETIRTIKFEDYWVKELQKREIDFMKLDVEGHELDVLEGMGSSLDATRILQFEFGGCNIDTRTYFKDFWSFLTNKGFIFYRISPLGPVRIYEYSERLEFFVSTNYLAVQGS